MDDLFWTVILLVCVAIEHPESDSRDQVVDLFFWEYGKCISLGILRGFVSVVEGVGVVGTMVQELG